MLISVFVDFHYLRFHQDLAEISFIMCIILYFVNTTLYNQSRFGKTSKITCELNVDSDHPWHSPSLISSHCALNRQLRALAFLIQNASTYEQRHEKINILHMRKQRRRSASR